MFFKRIIYCIVLVVVAVPLFPMTIFMGPIYWVVTGGDWLDVYYGNFNRFEQWILKKKGK